MPIIVTFTYIKNMKKLFLLDAYALIYRAYFAFIKNPRINSKGLNTSAILGFVNTLEEVIKKEKPTHLGVAFDPSGPTFRHEAFEAYKAQRESTPEDIKKAVPYIKDILKAYNIPIFEVKGFEADDVIGTLAKQAAKEGFQVYMLTPDKDYGQLVDENIYMYRPKHSGGYEILGIEEVKTKYGLENQEQVIDLLGLMGDSSDNIPGCPGVGEKTAVKLLQEFGNIENLLANIESLKGALKTKVENNVEQIKFSRFLATIRTDAPVEFKENEVLLEKPNIKELLQMFSELEFKSLISKYSENVPAVETNKKPTGPVQLSLFDMFDEAEKVVETTDKTAISEEKSIANTPHKYTLVENVNFADFIGNLSTQKEFCFDTETTGLDLYNDKLLGLSFSWKEHEAYYVPVNEGNKAEVLNALKPIFENQNTRKIGQNMKFDLMVLHLNNIELKGELCDCMIAHYLLQPELKHGMDYLAEVYLNYQTIHYEDLVGSKGKKQLTLEQISLDKVCDYAAEDADITFQLWKILANKIEEEKLEHLFYDIEMPLMQCLAKMELNGVRIDSSALNASAEKLREEILNIQKEVTEMAGEEFNLSSAKQVGEILFDKLKIVEKAKKTKTGQYVTSEEVLESLATKHPIVKKILEYRGIKKLLSTYVEALPELINPKTGKIHTSYNQTVTATGRLSSSNPNLQNIPIRDEMGKEIRRAFIPDEGHVFFSADYSQIELRIMAHLSEDENMVSAFNAGEDIHTATSAKIYGVDTSEVTKDMRRNAKTANFGIIYGISAFGLSERLGISRTEAKTLIEGYFKTYPQVQEYITNSVNKAKDNGYVETIFGRKRYLSDINSANSVVRAFAERNAVNAPIQGSAADIIKIAMVNIDRRFSSEGIKSQMILQVHDELNFNVLESELEKVKEIVIEEMQNAYKLRVPLIADYGVGKNWLEAH